MKHVLGIDVGGTKILIGLLSHDGQILYSKKYAMRRDTQQNAVDTIFSAVDDFLALLKDNNYPAPESIGMGTVGHIDYENGIWLQSYNISISTPVPIADIWKEKYGLQTYLDNDVHCATLGESHFGYGKETKCMIYVNVGTGISAGVVHHGMLIRGADNYAGEIGFMYMNCESDHGVLEPIASGGGLIQQAKKMLPQCPNSILNQYENEGRLYSSSIFEAAEDGDELAIFLAKRAIEFLGSALCNLIAIFNPDALVLGGGVVKEGSLCNKLHEYVLKHCVGESLKALRYFGLSKLDADKIGLIGAASLALDK